MDHQSETSETEDRVIPPCDTDGYFFDERGKVSSIPTQLTSGNPRIDENAVFSVLQFGAIVPPLSPWKQVRRLLPGYHYRGTQNLGPIKLDRRPEIGALDVEEQADEVERLLDAVLRKRIGDRRDPVLLFSGGVDSGIVAARLAAMGYRQSLLINYSFDADDAESQLAEAMAERLELPFLRVTASPSLISCLTKPGRLHPLPFADQSTAPTIDLGYAVVERLAGEKRMILDGTGADGAFGMLARIGRWERVARMPRVARKAASLAYAGGLWRRGGRIERAVRVVRRSAEMPLLSAVLAQNPLAGILYSEGPSKGIHALLRDWIAGWASEAPGQRIVAGDLALTCANIFAQKARPVLKAAGHEVVYPFLDADAVATAMAATQHWQMDEPKAPLKVALSRHVPSDMVYRPKSAFIDPKGSIFFSAEFVEYLRSAADASGPIAHLLETKLLRKACDLLARRKTLPAQTLNFLWAAVFTDRWYRTACESCHG